MRIILIIILGLLLTGCADLSIYDAQLAEKDATIANLQSDVVSKDAEIASLKAELAEKPEYISELRFFETVYELKAFLMNDDTSKRDYIPGKFDCDDFAITLMLNAEKAGYRIGLLIEKGDTKHMKNYAIVGTNAYYYWAIEPQDDSLIEGGLLD